MSGHIVDFGNGHIMTVIHSGRDTTPPTDWLSHFLAADFAQDAQRGCFSVATAEYLTRCQSAVRDRVSAYTTSAREVPEVIRRATDEMYRLIAGRGRQTRGGLAGREWTMCIPPHPHDSDMVFSDLIAASAQWHTELTSLRAQHKADTTRLREAAEALANFVEISVTPRFDQGTEVRHQLTQRAAAVRAALPSSSDAPAAIPPEVR